MYERYSKGVSYSAGFFMLIAFALAGIFMASLISIPIWTSMTGKNIMDIDKYLTDPRYANAIKIIQSLTAIIGFLIPAVFTAYLLNRRPLRLLGFTGKMTWKQAGLVTALILVSLLFSGFLTRINEVIPLTDSLRLQFEKLENEYMRQVEAIIGLNNVGEYLLAILIIAFLPAVCEEALFRGGMQNFMNRSTGKPWLSILVVSFIFSISHFSYYGFLPRFFLGIVLGAIYMYSGRLWLSILAHFLNNALAVTLLYSLRLEGKSIQQAMAESSGESYWGVLALPAVIYLLYAFQKNSERPLPEPIDPEKEELRNTPFY